MIFNIVIISYIDIPLKETVISNLDLAKEVTIKEHLFTLEELCQKIGTNLEKGISDAEADIRHKRDGPNAFTPPKMTPSWVLYIREMTTGFAIIIWLASIASFICYAIERLSQDVSVGSNIIMLINIFILVHFRCCISAGSTDYRYLFILTTGQ